MSKKVYCEVCGAEFQPKTANHKYCYDCSQKSLMAGHKRSCKLCGSPINSNNRKMICLTCQRQSKLSKKKETTDSLVLFEFERRAYNAEHGTRLSYGMYRACKERGWLK